MQKTLTTRPVNSLIFISDARGGEVPEWKRGELILATPSCISVGCYPEQDGPTTITISEAAQSDTRNPPAFDANLATPTRTVIVSNVEGGRLLGAAVPGFTTRVRIWTDHPQWPKNVVIALG